MSAVQSSRSFGPAGQDATEKIEWAWLTSTGAIDDTVSGAVTPFKVDGLVIMMVTVPDESNPPTDNYDITITDEDGRDVLGGNGANRDAVAIEDVQPARNPAAVSNTKLTLNVANAGAGGQGRTLLYIRK